jgi:hypothetical protein
MGPPTGGAQLNPWLAALLGALGGSAITIWWIWWAAERERDRGPW